MTGADNEGSLPVPTNCQAEQALLGAILRDNHALDHVVASLLTADRFADPVHVQLYRAICQRVSAGQTAHVAAVWDDAKNSAYLDEVGGLSYLVNLVGAVTGPINAAEYARSIQDAWARRVLIGVGEHLTALAADTTQSAFGESVSEFGEASGVEQAAYVASRLRGLLAAVEAISERPA